MQLLSAKIAPAAGPDDGGGYHLVIADPGPVRYEARFGGTTAPTCGMDVAAHVLLEVDERVTGSVALGGSSANAWVCTGAKQCASAPGAISIEPIREGEPVRGRYVLQTADGPKSASFVAAWCETKPLRARPSAKDLAPLPASCVDGELRKKDCNTCTCDANSWSCTEKGCGSARSWIRFGRESL